MNEFIFVFSPVSVCFALGGRKEERAKQMSLDDFFLVRVCFFPWGVQGEES